MARSRLREQPGTPLVPGWPLAEGAVSLRRVRASVAGGMPETLSLRFRKILDRALAPRYAHSATEDAGMDLYAAKEACLGPGKWASVRTGICIEIPPGYEGQVRPRSGLARSHGVTLLNSPGTIDPGYRGELQVTLINHGSEEYRVRVGDRIAQLVIGACASVQWRLVDCLGETVRGDGGFGSTGR